MSMDGHRLAVRHALWTRADMLYCAAPTARRRSVTIITVGDQQEIV